MIFPQIEYKTFLAYTRFIFDYGFKISLKIILYEFKFRNYYKDYTANYIPSNKLNVKNYDLQKITGYSPSYYYYLNLTKLFFENKNIKFDNLYDLGFGTGRVLYFLQNLANNIYGFEISKKLFDIGNIKLKEMISKKKKIRIIIYQRIKIFKI